MACCNFICGFSLLSDWHLKKLQSLEMNDVFLPNVWNVSFDVLTINAPITMAWISYDVAVKYLPFVFVFWLVEERGKREKKMENFKIFDVFLIEALPYCSKEDRGDVSGHQSPSHKWWMCVKSYEEEKYVTNQICLECPPPNFTARFSKKSSTSLQTSFSFGHQTGKTYTCGLPIIASFAIVINLNHASAKFA